MFEIQNSRIKPVFKCSEEFKSKFKNSRCLITISVGQEVHEGEKFLTTIDLINQSFKDCIVLIDDSLQRHTMKLNSSLSMDELYIKSLEEGKAWLNRNLEILKKLTIPHKIIYWDHWLKHAKYEEQHKIISERYETQLEYKKCFENTIEDFITRYRKHISADQFNYQKAFSLCLDYLKEECTALCLWLESNVNFEVYPNKRNQAMTITHDVFIKPAHPNLLLPVAIKFKNRKQFRPQKFSIDYRQTIE